MDTTRPIRRQDYMVFLFLVFIGYVLLGVCIPLGFLDYPRGTRMQTWLWFVATPGMLATELGANKLGSWLICFNPFIFATIWWSLWRFWKLFRSGREPENEGRS